MTEELRMVIAEPEATVTAKHVQAALEDSERINNNGQEWAELDIVPTKNGQAVHMRVGAIYNGVRQKEYQIVNYSFSYGKVHVVKSYLP